MRKPIGKPGSKNNARKIRRKLAIRKKVSGTPERPRLAVFKGNKNISVQVIDDVNGKTLFSVQTFGKNGLQVKANKDGAKEVGAKVAANLKEKNLETAVFDRGGALYHGVIASLADSIRENGIKL